jgi:hypothetical protein
MCDSRPAVGASGSLRSAAPLYISLSLTSLRLFNSHYNTGRLADPCGGGVAVRAAAEGAGGGLPPPQQTRHARPQRARQRQVGRQPARRWLCSGCSLHLPMSSSNVKGVSKCLCVGSGAAVFEAASLGPATLFFDASVTFIFFVVHCRHYHPSKNLYLQSAEGRAAFGLWQNGVRTRSNGRRNQDKLLATWLRFGSVECTIIRKRGGLSYVLLNAVWFKRVMMLHLCEIDVRNGSAWS